MSQPGHNPQVPFPMQNVPIQPPLMDGESVMQMQMQQGDTTLILHNGHTSPSPAVTTVQEDVEMDELQDNDDDDDLPLMNLPLSKIKRIFKMDQDYAGALQSAVYATGIATELFIQYFVEQASLIAKTEKRKKVVYKDFSSAVANHDTLTFLSDTVPKTQPIGELVQQKKVMTIQDKKPIATGENEDGKSYQTKLPVLPKGQQVLSFGKQPEPPKKVVLNDLVSSNGSSTEPNDVEMVDEKRL